MSFFHRPPAQNLSEWLDVATRDLVPSAQARIRAEIVAHYEEAMQSHLANGSPEFEAQAAALADLGSPQAAAMRFRQKYLTQTDLNHIRDTIRADGIWQSTAFKVFGPFLLVCLFCSAVWKSIHLTDWLLLGLVILPLLFWIAKAIATFVLAKRNAASAILRRVLLLRAIFEFIWSALVLVPTGWMVVSWVMLHAKPETHDWLVLALCIYWGSRAARECLGFFRLRKKLLSSGELWNELPPSKPVTA